MALTFSWSFLCANALAFNSQMLLLGCTGRSICTAQGLAMCFDRNCVFCEPLHFFACCVSGYACCSLHLCWRVSIPHSYGRESILLCWLIFCNRIRNKYLLPKHVLFTSYTLIASESCICLWNLLNKKICSPVNVSSIEKYWKANLNVIIIIILFNLRIGYEKVGN